MLDLVTIEADEAADLDDRDAPFGHQTAHVAQTGPKSHRNLFHGEKR